MRWCAVDEASAHSLRQRLAAAVDAAVARTPVLGRVTSVRGLTVVARVPDLTIGQVVEMDRRGGALRGQVIGLDGDEALILSLSPTEGLRAGAEVRVAGSFARVPDAASVRGRVIDSFGEPLDGGPRPSPWSGVEESRGLLGRRPLDRVLPTGVRAVDLFTTLAVGVRAGLFAGPGSGKSTLLWQLAAGIEADGLVVGLVGERSREVAEVVGALESSRWRGRATVVVATSDAPPLARLRAAEVATSLAEQVRGAGGHCLLMVDSLTRYVRAAREVAELRGESVPGASMPPGVAAQVSRLLERAGNSAAGAITAIYTVLVEREAFEAAEASELRGLLDAHLHLTARLARRGQFPALEPVGSSSRVASRALDADRLDTARLLRSALAELDEHRVAVEHGLYERGSLRSLDMALAVEPELRSLMSQSSTEHVAWHDAWAQAAVLAGRLR
jgi:FliI/YscN family ATPase